MLRAPPYKLTPPAPCSICGRSTGSRWNQKLIGKVYLADDGSLTGEHASECILPSTFGLTPATLTHGNRNQKA